MRKILTLRGGVLVIFSVLLTFMTLPVGCAEPASVAVSPDAKFTPYYVSSDPNTARADSVYEAADGKELGYVRYYRPGRQSRTALVYLHGIKSHGEWFGATADLLAAGGFDVFSLDRRGSGINRENRSHPSGHVDSYETLFSDLQFFLRTIRPKYDRVFLVGLSWGGNLAMGYSLVHPDDCDGLVLITPGIRSRVSPDLGTFLKIILGPRRAPFKIPITPDMLTVQADRQQRIRNDPLRLQYVTAGFLLEHKELLEHIDRKISSNRHPVLLILAGEDRIIDNQGVVRVLLRGGQERLDIINYARQTHSVQLEIPDRLAAAIRSWIEEISNFDAEAQSHRP